MKEMSSTEAKRYFGKLLEMAQQEPVMIHKKRQPMGVMLSMQDFAAHEVMKLMLLQHAIDAGLASGISDRTFKEVVAEAEAAAEGEKAADP